MPQLIVLMRHIEALGQLNFKLLITKSIFSNKDSKEKVQLHLCNIGKEIINSSKKFKKRRSKTTHLILFPNSQVKSISLPFLKVRHKYKSKNNLSKIITNHSNKALRWFKIHEITFPNDL
jgi:hypothetical protein